MVLNEDFDFSFAPSEVHRAFIGIPVRVRLKKDTRLFKRAGYKELSIRNITPWWSYERHTTLPNGLVAEGLPESTARASVLGVTPQLYTRARWAVSDDFKNTLDNLLRIQLLTDIDGFAGRTSSQFRFDEDSRKHNSLERVVLIGGNVQLWIPELTLEYVKQV